MNGFRSVTNTWISAANSSLFQSIFFCALPHCSTFRAILKHGGLGPLIAFVIIVCVRKDTE